jgi:hypothetical protein
MKRSVSRCIAVIGILSFGCANQDESDPKCGDGTIEKGGACVADIVCADGTHVAGGMCLPDVVCADGTYAQDGKCLPNLGCGEGTHFDQGKCVPDYPEVTCAAGTTLEGLTCVPDQETLICGEGTEKVDSECVPVPSESDCGAGTTLYGDVCVPSNIQHVALPFEAGSIVTIVQATFGFFSHKNKGGYAVDFLVPEGTVITAARGGRVLALKEDSNTGCGDISCADQTNYIQIDHGDGTFGNYLHLKQDGATVEIGSHVCRGQPIGHSGNTGFSALPHLHLEIRNLQNRTVPLHFEAFESITGGYPIAGVELVSANVDPGTCAQEFEFSNCPSDEFLFLGIRLETAPPCAVATMNQAYPISGWHLAKNGKVAIGSYHPDTGWSYDCATPDDDGYFQTTITWSSAKYGAILGAPYTHLMIVAADDTCTPYQGWEYSPRVWLE